MTRNALPSSFLRLATLLLACTQVSLAAQREAAVTQAPSLTIVDSIAPPTTLAGMWTAADFVVSAVVRKAEAPSLQKMARISVVVRYASIDVVEVFKRDADELPAPIRVKQYGGTVREHGRDFSTGYVGDPLRQGDSVVLFLIRSVSDKSYEVAYGSAGLLKISYSAVILSDGLRVMPEFRGTGALSRDSFFERLRSMGRR